MFRIRICSTRGFTLLEMLVVIMIMGFLVAMVAGGFSRLKGDAAITTTLSEMKSIKEAIRDRFYPDLGLIPYNIDNPEWATRYLCLKNDGTGNSEYEEIRGFIGDDLMTWDRYVRKGWRGPYMEREATARDDNGTPLNPADDKWYPVLADAWFDSEKSEEDTGHYYRIMFSDLDGLGDMTNSDAAGARRERLSTYILSLGANGEDNREFIIGTTASETYRCIKTHTSSNSNCPTTGSEWEEYWIFDSSEPSAAVRVAWDSGTSYDCKDDIIMYIFGTEPIQSP